MLNNSELNLFIVSYKKLKGNNYNSKKIYDNGKEELTYKNEHFLRVLINFVIILATKGINNQTITT